MTQDEMMMMMNSYFHQRFMPLKHIYIDILLEKIIYSDVDVEKNIFGALQQRTNENRNNKVREREREGEILQFHINHLRNLPSSTKTSLTERKRSRIYLCHYFAASFRTRFNAKVSGGDGALCIL
jgi:hypothetical protein